MGIRVLFVYPNLFGMNMLPPAIGILNAILLQDGHTTALFDTTNYGQWNHLDVVSDRLKEDRLNARPTDDTRLKTSMRLEAPGPDFVRTVQEFEPDLLAFSVTEDMYPNALELLRFLPEGSRPPTVMGGVFATFAPRLALVRAAGLVDFAITGEGETSLAKLCSSLERGSDIHLVPGIAFFEADGSFYKNPLPGLVNPDNVPLPNYDLFDESRFYRPMQGQLRRMFPVETIRGCPYTCAYCNSPSQNAIYAESKITFLRKTSTEKIFEQIRHLVDNYQPDSLYFWADTFLAQSENEFDAFCDMYSEFKLPFWIQTRPETVTKRKFKRLKEVGLLRVSFGVEHGNGDFREKVLMRRVENSLVVENLNLLSDLEVPFSVNNIVGFPHETRELAFDTIELNRMIRSDGINAYSFTPFHGTPLRTVAELAGFVKPGEITRSIMKPTMLRMPHWSKQSIEGFRRCFVLYVKLPKDRWREVEQAESLTPEGDGIWDELREEVLQNYMPWGDRAEEEDAGKIELEEEDFSVDDAAGSSLLGSVQMRE
jgi:radical SAM superfamily enzyme YgiQ (UPF0313 family)